MHLSHFNVAPRGWHPDSGLGTRIWKNLGLTDEKLLAEFETLSPDGLKNAWAFFTTNKAEVDAQVAQNELV